MASIVGVFVSRRVTGQLGHTNDAGTKDIATEVFVYGFAKSLLDLGIRCLEKNTTKSTPQVNSE